MDKQTRVNDKLIATNKTRVNNILEDRRSPEKSRL